MAPKKNDRVAEEVSVVEIKRKQATFCILGLEPVIFNAMSEKAKRELLLPSRKKTTAEKQTTLKHNPFQEYRDSIYRDLDPKAPTLILGKSTWFKNAMAYAAIDMPGGTSKAAIGRLTYVEGSYVPIHGRPTLHMAVAKQAGIQGSPDIRTRACIAEWACEITVTFVTPMVTEQMVANLLVGAGLMQGVGDFRQQKGKGNHGTFEVVSPSNERWKCIMAIGREQQEAAMADPIPFDSETAALLSWFTDEAKRREFNIDDEVEDEADAEVNA